jgi:putative ABC transport system permease protein
MFQTGIGTNMMLMTIISFIIGLSISGQTFYTFVIENLEKFGALKAIGAKGRELIDDSVPGLVRGADRLRHRASACAR